jgi:hypothetical protein
LLSARRAGGGGDCDVRIDEGGETSRIVVGSDGLGGATGIPGRFMDAMIDGLPAPPLPGVAGEAGNARGRGDSAFRPLGEDAERMNDSFTPCATGVGGSCSSSSGMGVGSAGLVVRLDDPVSSFECLCTTGEVDAAPTRLGGLKLSLRRLEVRFRPRSPFRLFSDSDELAREEHRELRPRSRPPV